jgi:type I restriction enzyme S subunit
VIADLKPYPEYKDSGLPWLGHVPGHWETRPAFGAFEPNRERNCGMKEKTVLSLSYGRIVIKPAEKLHGLVPESFETYQIVNPGDIVIRTTDLQNDHTSLRVGMVRNRGIITSAYLALKLKAGVIPEFGFQFLNVWDTSKAIYEYGSGLRQNLDFSHFKRMPVALPPPSEQAAIVRFLEWANGRLEKAIRAKKKIIALLNEQKQAIIHSAVTRGLDPNVPLKDSGIPWLGKIPEHWELSRIKNEFQSLNTQRIPLNSVERGQMTSRLYDYYGASGVIDKVESYLFDDELLLIAEDGANLVLRNLPLAIIARGKFWVNNHAHILKPKRGNIAYLANVLETINYQPWISGAAQPKLTQDRLLSISIAVAPPEEQAAIVAHTTITTQPLVAAITRLEREIELLREYRTRLVADVVTGKLDVREAAKNLPEELAAESDEADLSELSEDDLEDSALQEDEA